MRRPAARLAGLGVALALAAAPSAAEDRCAEPERAALDPWLGTWQASSGGSPVFARTTLRRALDGCAVEQDWESDDGMRARALWAWQARTGRWHLAWVETRGPVMILEGVFEGDRLVLEGDVPTRDGGFTRRRLTVRAGEGGGWQQVWEESRDGGASWQESFRLDLRRPPNPAGDP